MDANGNGNKLKEADLTATRGEREPIMNKIELLKNKIEELIASCGCNAGGIYFLLNYYMTALGWTELDSLEYIVELFEHKVIDDIMVLCSNGERL